MIQQNKFNAQARPTTQEDNFGAIKRRFDLYHVFSNENNGNEFSKHVGNLVEYFDGTFAVFHSMIRYDFPKEQIEIF